MIICTICKKSKRDEEFSWKQRRKIFNNPKHKTKCLQCVECRSDWQCEICGGIDDGKQLAVDHDHLTGHVRGRLCSSCNRGLGLFKDSIPVMERAIHYLRRHWSEYVGETTEMAETLARVERDSE
jgi:hypothetical protein